MFIRNHPPQRMCCVLRHSVPSFLAQWTFLSLLEHTTYFSLQKSRWLPVSFPSSIISISFESLRVYEHWIQDIRCYPWHAEHTSSVASYECHVIMLKYKTPSGMSPWSYLIIVIIRRVESVIGGIHCRTVVVRGEEAFLKAEGVTPSMEC